MTTTVPTGHRNRLEAAILDYNGVLGIQPRPAQWNALALGGVNKPHRRAYEAALAAAGRPTPERTLFADDPDNVEAAAALGLRGHHYTGDAVELARPVGQPARLP